MDQDQAARWLVYNRYTLTGGKVWKITQDDPEGWWEGNPIARWTGIDFVALVELLKAHDLPTSFLQCVTCHDAEVSDLGDICQRCADDDSVSAWGDIGYSIRSGK